jgi:hypothetical protein
MQVSGVCMSTSHERLLSCQLSFVGHGCGACEFHRIEVTGPGVVPPVLHR